jgi:hypothetical protein
MEESMEIEFGDFGDQVNRSMHRNIAQMFAEAKPFFLDKREANETLTGIRRDLAALLLQTVIKPSP